MMIALQLALTLWPLALHPLAAGSAADIISRRTYGVQLSAKGLPVAVYTSEACVGHDPGWMHPEKPERLTTLLNAMRGEWARAFGDRMRVHEPEVEVTDEQLLRVHTPEHLKVVEDAYKQLNLIRRQVKIDADTVVSPGSQLAAKRAAGLVVAAVDDLMSRSAEVKRAFVMVRPPGHHAEADKPQGFCLYNNVLVGVAHAQAVHGIKRVAILDFDVHHGNGDEAIAMTDRSRLYASSHQSPCYPGTGLTPGASGPHKNIWNVPLEPGAGSAEFRAAWTKTLLPAVRRFKPDAIFISAGFDAHAEDPLASVELSDEDFSWITKEIVSTVGNGRLPIISVLEGGYNVVSLERAVRAHLEALMKA